MDTYQCPACGSTVTRAGCQRCGQPYDPDVAALALFKRTVAALEAKKRKLTNEQLLLRTQLAHASAQRDSLSRKIRDKAEAENPSARRPGRTLRRMITRRGGARETAEPVAGPRAAAGGVAAPTTPRAAAPAAAPPMETPTTQPPPKEAPPKAAPPRETRQAAAPPREAPSREAPPGEARQAAAPPREAPPKAAPPRETRQAAAPPREAPPREAPPREAPPREAPPREAPPREARQAAAPPKEAPPKKARPTAAPPGTGGLPPNIAARLPDVLARRSRARWVPRRSRPPVRARGRVGGAETTTRTTQTVLLGLGGLLLGGAAVVLAVVAFASVGTAGRVVLLTLATPLTLGLPVVLARRRLIATAETVAGVGLLLVLLSGYVAWSLRLFGAGLLPTSVYFGMVCLVTAAVATAYRAVSHLIAPRYATVLVLQPVVPLLAYPWIRGATGWALVFVVVAALDLALAIGVTRVGGLAAFFGLPPLPAIPPVRLPGPSDPEPDPEPPLDSSVVEPGATTVLQELTWVLFAAAFGAALSYGSASLLTAHTVPAATRAAVVMLLAAAVGIGGAQVWRRSPANDVAAGLATLALVVSATRVGAVAMPGHALLFAALSVSVAALAIRGLPDSGRRGAAIANSAAAVCVALFTIVRAAPAIGAPLRAALPIWHADPVAYRHTLVNAAGTDGWQLVVVGVLLTIACRLVVPEPARYQSTVAASVLTVLVTPAGLGLDWAAAPAVLTCAAIAYGGAALAVRGAELSRSCLVAAGLVGLFATAASLTRPGATALVLTAIVFAGVVIAGPRATRPDPYAEAVAQQVQETAAGGAAFALPGAVAIGLWALITERVLPGAGTTTVLAGGFLAVCGTLGYSAITQVARRRPSPTLLLGTTLGTGAVAVAALATPHRDAIDMSIGLLLFASAVLLWMAPNLASRDVYGLHLEGPDVAAAAVTASIIAALSRVLSLAVPGVWLVVTAFLVLLTSVAVRGVPERWGRGPTAGSALVGVLVAVLTGASAVGGAIGVIRAASPAWHANLAAWPKVAQTYTGFGWQAPIALLLVAAAAAVALPEPDGDVTATIAIGLATVGAPAGLGLPWWSPMALGVAATAGLGLAATLTSFPRTAYIRVAVAGAIGLYAAGASLVRPAATGATLQSLGLVCALVAGFAGVRIAAARTVELRLTRAHLVPVGGGAAAAAVVTFAAACATFAAAEQRPPSVVLAGALAATSVSLALAGVLCWRLSGYLPFVTVGVAVSGTSIAVASVLVDRRSAGVYAAAAALLGVCAELMRVAGRQRTGWRPEDGWQPVRPAGGWSPGVQRGARPYAGRPPYPRATHPPDVWRPAVRDFGLGALAASIVPAAIAVLVLARPVGAALVAPYHWATRPWTGTPGTSAFLGQYARWTGDSTDVIAALALTLAGALAAVGLGGRTDSDAESVADRFVAVAIPGIALTLLIAPGATHAPGPMYATAALIVATICGLSLALTRPAPDTEQGHLLRAARRIVFVLAVLAAGAGGAGSLATRSATIEWLAGSVVVGLIGAIFGRYLLARVIGWNVAGSTAQLLALAATLAVGAPARWAAFPVLGVSAVLMAFPNVLPRLFRRDGTGYETLVIEATGYAGAAGALALTWGAPRYTAAVCTALGAVLGLAASRPGRTDRYRRTIIFIAALSEVVAVWLIMSLGRVALIEAYTLPFAMLALLVGLLELRVRPELGSWLGYGPALVTGFLPTLVIVLASDATPFRRVGLITAAVLTVAVGSIRRLQAPVVIGTVVTAVAMLHELFLLGRLLPWWVLLVLFTGAGVLLVALGATYERRRRRLSRLRGSVGRMR